MPRIIASKTAIRLGYSLNPSGVFSLTSRSPAQYLRENDVAISTTCQSRQTSPKPKNETPKKGWGALGTKERMTRRQAKRLSERVAGIEAWYGKDNCRFFTGTLPSVHPDAFKALAEWSGWLVDRIGKWIKRELGADCARVFVWEYQRRGALHLHAIVGGSNIGHMFAKGLRYQWIRGLFMIGQKTGVNMFQGRRGQNFWKSQHKIRARTEKLKKSAVAYLSKYLSKSSHANNKSLHGCNRKGVFFPVPSWCQWDRNATKCWAKTRNHGILGFCSPEVWPIIKSGAMAIAEKYKAKNTEVKEHEKFYSSGINAIIPAKNRSEFLSEIEAISSFCLEKSTSIVTISLQEFIDHHKRILNQHLWWQSQQQLHDMALTFYEQKGRIDSAIGVKHEYPCTQLELPLPYLPGMAV